MFWEKFKRKKINFLPHGLCLEVFHLHLSVPTVPWRPGRNWGCPSALEPPLAPVMGSQRGTSTLGFMWWWGTNHLSWVPGRHWTNWATCEPQHLQYCSLSLGTKSSHACSQNYLLLWHQFSKPKAHSYILLSSIFPLSLIFIEAWTYLLRLAI